MKTIYYPGWGVVWKIYSRENLKKSIWFLLVFLEPYHKFLQLSLILFFFCYLFLFGKSFFRFNRVCCFDNSICGSKYAWVYFVRLCFNDGIEQL